jgi:hypothetical protein
MLYYLTSIVTCVFCSLCPCLAPKSDEQRLDMSDRGGLRRYRRMPAPSRWASPNLKVAATSTLALPPAPPSPCSLATVEEEDVVTDIDLDDDPFRALTPDAARIAAITTKLLRRECSTPNRGDKVTRLTP